MRSTVNNKIEYPSFLAKFLFLKDRVENDSPFHPRGMSCGSRVVYHLQNISGNSASFVNGTRLLVSSTGKFPVAAGRLKR